MIKATDTFDALSAAVSANGDTFGSRFPASGRLRLTARGTGELRGPIKLAHEVTEHHAAAQALLRQPQVDELTGLPNRRTFLEHVRRAIASRQRGFTNLFAVLFIDFDHFTNVNAEFGHIVADQLLAVAARRLERCVRGEDIVARIGADEFAILLNGISGSAGANEVAERACRAMGEPVTLEHRITRATVSVGIALGSETYGRSEDILRDAGSAVRAAKTEGRGRTAAFSSSPATLGGVAFDFALEIHRAIECGELQVAYQPIIRLHDSTRLGFEALIRWEHPRLGLLAPVQFIPKAEQSDLILSIDRWMIRKACRQLANWEAEGIGSGLQMSVNVSSKEFARSAFLGELQETLEQSGLMPGQLRLEMSEGAVMERSARSDALIAAVRMLGVKLDVDDFGSGYSSLGALQNISLAAFKIDASLVANMNSHFEAKLVQAAITLAHDVGLAAIAKGVETSEQLAQLVTFGCDFGQGFFFAPPLSAGAACSFSVKGCGARVTSYRPDCADAARASRT